MAKLSNKKWKKYALTKKKFCRKDSRGQLHQHVYVQLLSVQIPKAQKSCFS